MRGQTRAIDTRWGLAVLLLAAICLWPTLGRAACSVVENGTYIEAEKYTTGGADWLTRSSTSGYNGSGYLEANDSDSSLPLKGSLTPVHYQLNFPSTGVYYIWFRGNDGDDSGQNSIWYGIDGSVSGNATTPGSNNNWNWTNTRQDNGPSPTQLNITSAGTHTIYIWPREDNFKLDGFYLRKTNSRPNGNIPGGATVVDPTSASCSGGDPDNDGDGFPVSTDCNDGNAAINPGASDNNCNGVDDNCNGVVDDGCDPDSDGDGFTVGAGDCNDGNAAVNPGVSDNNCNGVDDNCNGVVDDGCDPDTDGDGYTQSLDCNDTSAAINPGALEVCGNGVDDNCNGLADEGCDPDFDGDGATVGAGNDCDDNNPLVRPGAVELCDGIDNNCDGTIDHAGCDLDGDGSLSGADCNDNNSNIHPGAAEICDGIDNNCDGSIDEGGVCDVVLPPDSTGDISQIPLFLSQTAPPLNLLVLGRDHKLYYEAYNDASDLNGDGLPDVGYKPAAINYYGYFDSFKCYSYDSGGGKFVPQSTTTTKMCGGSSWSGDFLNYLTTSRIDALRKVLYGGKRSTDSTSATVLERSHIPQDAHSWGKEYKGLTAEGYDIRQYSTLPLPEAGYRHLFANTTLGGSVATANPGAPMLRVMPNSRFRAWEWVSIERPVAGSDCDNGSRTGCQNASATSTWEVVPNSAFSNLVMTTWDFSSLGLGHPDTHSEFDTFVNTVVADAGRRIGAGSVSRIDGDTNPFNGQQDNYLSLFSGKIVIPSEGTWTFAVDGDDAVEVMIDGTVVADYYGAHGTCGCQSHSGTIYLTAGQHDIVFRHEEQTGGSGYRLFWQRTIPVSTITDYTVRVEVCKPSLLEANCKTYPNNQAKPTGLLHEYGEDDRMKFGLLTGSYTKNTSGGVLRKKVSSFTNEVNPDTGQFTSTVGIVKTIDKLRTVGFDGGSQSYSDNCGWITTYALTEGNCRMWGNPVAEMMYEGLRYFAGKGSPSSAFSYSNSSGDDFNLGLPLATWDNPYAAGNNEYCAKPFQLVISDINPSYDSDQLPGSYFGSYTGDVTNLDVGALGTAIWNHEFGSGTGQDIFIGQSGTNYNGSPTVKTANSFRSIRGLTPEEPTKQGSYYAGSIAYFGQTNDINGVNDVQKMNTFTVALASPLPQINIRAGGHDVILVPFAKSVGGSNITTTAGSFQPTNTIVDYYIDSISPTEGRFRINFEDVEQGADHDMDAIVEYHYLVNPDDSITVNLNSTYAAGGIIQHMGYVISGTTADGTYLEVRDKDTAVGDDPDFFLDTPPGVNPGGVWADGAALPLTATRTFTPASSGTATFLKNPLWYAAKFGKFKDQDGNDLPDTGEWDEDANGVPDNYFLVTNALTLSSQLGTAFNEIIGAATSAAAIATNSTRLDTDTLIYQARFNSGDWSGQLLAFPVTADGSVGTERWDAGTRIPAEASRQIFTYTPPVSGIGKGTGATLEWANLDGDQQAALNRSAAGVVDALGSARLDYIRGDQSLEQQNGGNFRDRSRILGDIVNSDPLFVGLQNYGYNALASTEGTSYLDFRLASSYRTRTKMLYFGANDGMLHGINANTGDEVFTYVPNSVIPYLNQLTSPSYEHRYTVDGLLGAGDVYIDVNNDSVKEWRTVLVGSLGAGGKGIFALDVTDPANFSASNVLWEITPSYTPDGTTFPYADLGFTIQQPYLVRMANGKWAMVIGNGYPATATTSSKAVIYVIDVADGSLIWKLEVDNTSGNGLSGPAPIDIDGNRVVDHIYAGDLKGNLWRFDVGDVDPADWDVAFRVNPGSVPKPLYMARGPSGLVQPITARPEIGRGPDDGTFMIYFGTGRYFGATDNIVPVSPPVNSFYGILDSQDNQARITATDRSVLTQQSITAEPVAFNRRFRVTTTNAWDDNKKGWYLDLISPVSGAQGERVVDPAKLNGEMLIFTTIIPSSSTCAFGGSGWLMELRPHSGGRPDKPALDVNDDGLINENDKVDDGSGNLVNPSGEGENTENSEGIITSPGIIDAGDKQYKFMSTSSGLIKTVTEANTGANVGRGSWRQLR